jgi:TRAP-type C4-dicarboxylate transport system permease small subunit
MRDLDMAVFKTHIFLLARKLDMLAAVAIVAMMCLTCADVLLRLFRRPITGTYELVSFLGALAVSFALAHTTAEKSHVAVSLVVRVLPQKIQGIIEGLVSLAGIVLFALISWQSVLYGMDCQQCGEVSLTLELPVYPIIYGIAFGAAVVCLVLLADLMDAIAKVKTR